LSKYVIQSTTVTVRGDCEEDVNVKQLHGKLIVVVVVVLVVLVLLVVVDVVDVDVVVDVLVVDVVDVVGTLQDVLFTQIVRDAII
jgi:hypothetical protein